LEERPTIAIEASATDTEPLDLADLDAERHEADRLVHRGYDVDDTAPSHAEFIARQRTANTVTTDDRP
jgi:hypothetical protein